MKIKPIAFLIGFALLTINASAQEKKPNPLVILDGVKMSADSFRHKNIAPMEIESVTKLKDSLATQLLGTPVPDGLIFVITKANKNTSENVLLLEKISGLRQANGQRSNLNEVKKDSIQNNSTLLSIEYPPKFPGGLLSFYRYIGESVKYPKTAIKNKTEGKVIVSFVIEKDGSVTDATIKQGLTPETDAEAIRVIESSPRWEPGYQNGKAVRVKYNFSVNFNLNKK